MGERVCESDGGRVGAQVWRSGSSSDLAHAHAHAFFHAHAQASRRRNPHFRPCSGTRLHTPSSHALALTSFPALALPLPRHLRAPALTHTLGRRGERCCVSVEKIEASGGESVRSSVGGSEGDGERGGEWERERERERVSVEKWKPFHPHPRSRFHSLSHWPTLERVGWSEGESVGEVGARAWARVWAWTTPWTVDKSRATV